MNILPAVLLNGISNTARYICKIPRERNAFSHIQRNPTDHKFSFRTYSRWNEPDDPNDCDKRATNHVKAKYKHLIKVLKEDAEKREMLNIRKSKERKESAKGGKKSSMLLRRLRGKGTKQIKQGRIADRNIIFVAGLGSIGMGASREILKKGPKNLLIFGRSIKPKAMEELKRINKKANIKFYKYDVTLPLEASRELLHKVFEEYKKIDLLINGAGLLDEHQIAKTVDVNFKGTVNTTTAIMDFWDKRRGGPGGVIANLCSASAFNPIYQLPVYSASKAAVLSFTISLAKLAPLTGVTAFSFNPGITQNPLKNKCNSWLNVEPCVGKLLLIHPTQTTKQAGKSLVEVLEANRNGVIWKVDQGRLEAVKWLGQRYWDSGI
ncbi:alcohol dehydrogenase [Drosophila mojavensis]|uniref:Alcohol dehydrogenase n=1 Tax=Drosophila mojavensis TaxID=7230 RepID=B4KI75_DROMO|nr:alcohol dehydrogenase [Drosophila mojavensis]EDW12368.2 uncharacterized protein Dmoj_GI10333 [Drosophila mojavensis]